MDKKMKWVIDNSIKELKENLTEENLGKIEILEKLKKCTPVVEVTKEGDIRHIQ